MIRSIIVITLMIGTTAGCSSMPVMDRMEAFEEASRAYGEAISWSEYDIAAAFLKTDNEDKVAAEIEHLKNFKVTAYEPRLMTVLEKEDHIRQVVRISYFKNDHLIVKSVRDDQLWEYNPPMRTWFLLSGFPKLE